MTQRNYDASMLTSLRRDRAAADFFKRQRLLTDQSNPLVVYPSINPQTSNYDASVMGQIANGSFTTWTKPCILAIPSVPCSCTALGPFRTDPSDPCYQTDTAILLALEQLLAYCAPLTNPGGPTVMSRTLYAWFLSVAGGVNWAAGSLGPLLPAVTDRWDWSVQPAALNEADLSTWTTLILLQVMTTMVPGYNSGPLLAFEQGIRRWTPAQQTSAQMAVMTAGNWAGWLSAWTAWKTYRGLDGSAAASAGGTPATAPSVFPNGSTYLDVNGTVDPGTFARPDLWTPLLIQGTTRQKYYTYAWHDVSSTCLSSGDESDLSGTAAAFFPTVPQRVAEIGDLVTMTATLTDTEKVTAEWWAGGPGTVTPPGMMVWFWKNYVSTYQVFETLGPTVFWRSGLQLAVNLFEAGRVVWGLKRAYEQARPIQEVRRLYYGLPVTRYDGVSISGESWIPYQEASFVTPGFPDFPSGHSAFSQVFAATMTQWFGSSVRADGSIVLSDLTLMSPMFTGSQTLPYGSVVVPSGSSRVQPSVVPSAPVTLSWPTWQAIADSAGISRQYGGIHCPSAHVASQAVATQLVGLVRGYWGF